VTTDRPYVLFQDKPDRPWRSGGEWSLWHQPTVAARPEWVADGLRHGSALSLQRRLNAAAAVAKCMDGVA
jgi:hypothetical protein